MCCCVAKVVCHSIFYIYFILGIEESVFFFFNEQRLHALLCSAVLPLLISVPAHIFIDKVLLHCSVSFTFLFSLWDKKIHPFTYNKSWFSVGTNFYFHTNIFSKNFYLYPSNPKKNMLGNHYFDDYLRHFCCWSPHTGFSLVITTLAVPFYPSMYLYFYVFNSLFIQLYSHTVLHFLSHQVRFFFLFWLLSLKNWTFCFYSSFYFT